MYKPVVKVGIGYLVITAIYYIISAILFQQSQKEGGTIIEQLLYAFSNFFFWITVHMYFFIFLLASSVLGMIIAKIKNHQDYFLVFRNILIAVVLFILTISVLQKI